MSTKTHYLRTTISGGGESALDAILSDEINDGDICDVFDISNYNWRYILDADSGLDENIPYIIKPDTASGAKRWILQTYLLDDRYYTESEIDGMLITTFSGLSDTPVLYEDNKYLRSTASGTEWATVSDIVDYLWVTWSGTIDHDTINNYSVDEHRTINDGATGSTDLWSAQKIDSEIVAASGIFIEKELFDADTFLYATDDDTPVATSPANVMAALSGHAGATFNFNSQALTGITTATLASTGWLGLASNKGRLVFTDAATDTAAFTGCNVGINCVPGAKFEVGDGNIRISNSTSSSYGELAVDNTGWFDILNYKHGGAMRLIGETMGGATVNLFYATPNGGSHLYWVGAIKFKTTATGADVTGCITDDTCEIYTEDALSIIEDIMNTGCGVLDEYGHERFDMKKLHPKYPFLFPEVIREDKVCYGDKLGAKSDLLYRAVMQLLEQNQKLTQRIEQLEAS